MVVAAAMLAGGVLGDDILQTIGFTNCKSNARVMVQKVDITYNNNNKTVSFDVQGTSSRVQNVTAVLNVTAYGNQIYSNSFNPCDRKTFVEQLCPGRSRSVRSRAPEKERGRGAERGKPRGREKDGRIGSKSHC